MIRIAVPNKGRLHEPTLSLFKDSGLPIYGGGNESRKLISKTSDPEIMFIFARSADIPLFVEEGTADLGITGLDLVVEKNADVELLTKTGFGSSKLVLAVPESSDINSVDQLHSKRIATEFPEITKNFMSEMNIKDVEIIEVSGACEMTPHIGVADAIVDITSSGTTLLINKLVEIGTVFKSDVYLIANKESLKDPEKQKIHDVKMAVESVLRAKSKRYLMMNVPERFMEDVQKLLPGLSGPTIMEVKSSEKTYAIHVVVDADDIFTLVGKLKDAGANGILVLPIERLIP